jgi:HPt (histidine-containing phosphotransfer) domain-containing protein
VTNAYRHIDPAVLRNAAGDDDEGFKELLAMFVRIVPPMLVELDQAVRDGRYADISHHAHSMKSCMSLVGARAGSKCLEQLERAARTGASDCADGYAVLHEEITAVIADAMACEAATATNKDNDDYRGA